MSRHLPTRLTGCGAALRSALLAVVLALVAPAGPLRAQTIVGTVVAADAVTPVARVLVELRLGSGSVSRLLTDARGGFRLQLPLADSVTVRVLRPGFQPVVHPAVAVEQGRTRELRIVLTNATVTLATVEVRESHPCGNRADANGWQLMREARTVLQSIELTERDSTIQLWTLEYQGEATSGNAVLIQDSTVRRVPVEAPLPRSHQDALFRRGYVERLRDTTTYYAPSAAVLADDRFVERYCFRMVTADSSPEGMVGVRFEPLRRPRREVTEIAGTFWLDDRTYVLRQIDFAYLNLPVNHRAEGAGGYVLFTQLASGHWILNEWMIRMPNLIAHHGARQRFRRADGTYAMERNGVIPLEGVPLRAEYGLWARARTVYRVQLDERTLLFDATVDSLARRALGAGGPPSPPPLVPPTPTVFRRRH